MRAGAALLSPSLPSAVAAWARTEAFSSRRSLMSFATSRFSRCFCTLGAPRIRRSRGMPKLAGKVETALQESAPLGDTGGAVARFPLRNVFGRILDLHLAPHFSNTVHVARGIENVLELIAESIAFQRHVPLFSGNDDRTGMLD